MAVEEYSVHGSDDGHLDSLASGERVGAPGGRHTFSDGLLPDQRLGQRGALSDGNTDRAVSTERACAREHEVTEAGEASEGGGPRAECISQTGHLGEAARDEGRARIEAEADALDDSGRDGHDVLERAA